MRRERFAQAKEGRRYFALPQSAGAVIAKVFKNKGDGLAYNPMHNMLSKNVRVFETLKANSRFWNCDETTVDHRGHLPDDYFSDDDFECAALI